MTATSPHVQGHTRTGHLRIPGISLMEVRPVAGGVLVCCPGCCAEQVFSPASETPTFVHADKGCPVHRQVEAALLEFDIFDLETPLAALIERH